MVFSASAGRYVVDPGRGGAPGDGMRIVLYQPRRNRLREIGWMDMRDAVPSSPNTWH